MTRDIKYMVHADHVETVDGPTQRIHRVLRVYGDGSFATFRTSPMVSSDWHQIATMSLHELRFIMRHARRAARRARWEHFTRRRSRDQG